MSITLDWLPEPDSRTAGQGTYELWYEQGAVHGPELCCGQRRRPDAANAACLSLARSLTECAAVRRGAQRSQRPGARHVSVQQRLRSARPARRAVLVRCARAGMWPAARAPDVPRRGGSWRLGLRGGSRPAWTGYGMYWQGHRTVKAVGIDRGSQEQQRWFS